MDKQPGKVTPQMERHAYQISHLIASFTVPVMRNLYHQFDGDMVQIIVLGEISMRNVSQFFRKGGADAPPLHRREGRRSPTTTAPTTTTRAAALPNQALGSSQPAAGAAGTAAGVAVEDPAGEGVPLAAGLPDQVASR